ncbi:HpcH/HpaI aldolase family protein [Pararhodobacter oceanensis]|nr:aldolase/citrate lyase family protein [Pararhodobacter oceanensis]
MVTPQNFRQMLRDGAPLSGIFQCTTSFQIAEILSHSALDYICLEAEHGATSLPLIHAQVAAIADRKPVIVRVAPMDLRAIKPVLDLGVTGIMVADVRSADEAREIVAHTRFAPEGKRGIGGSIRASRYGMDASYFPEGPEQPITVILQIESQEAIDNIAEISAVDGVDAVFIGPMDLSAQLGHRADPAAPKVQNAITTALALAKDSGTASGILCPPAKVAEWTAEGVSLFLLGSDIGALVGSVNAMMSTAKEG